MAEPGISSNESITTREARRADIAAENIHFEKNLKKIIMFSTHSQFITTLKIVKRIFWTRNRPNRL